MRWLILPSASRFRTLPPRRRPFVCTRHSRCVRCGRLGSSLAAPTLCPATPAPLLLPPATTGCSPAPAYLPRVIRSAYVVAAAAECPPSWRPPIRTRPSGPCPTRPGIVPRGSGQSGQRPRVGGRVGRPKIPGSPLRHCRPVTRRPTALTLPSPALPQTATPVRRTLPATTEECHVPPAEQMSHQDRPSWRTSRQVDRTQALCLRLLPESTRYAIRCFWPGRADGRAGVGTSSHWRLSTSIYKRQTLSKWLWQGYAPYPQPKTSYGSV